MSDNVQIEWTADTVLAFLASQRDTLRAMGVKKLGLFGSYVRGEQTPTSDMDFLFILEDFTWRHWMDVWNFLEAHFDCEVDLVPEEDLREELKPYVLPEVRYVPDI